MACAILPGYFALGVNPRIPENEFPFFATELLRIADFEEFLRESTIVSQQPEFAISLEERD